jgi:hypothetical protein
MKGSGLAVDGKIKGKMKRGFEEGIEKSVTQNVRVLGSGARAHELRLNSGLHFG